MSTPFGAGCGPVERARDRQMLAVTVAVCADG